MSFAMFRSVNPCQLPASALLQRYVTQGAYTDCHVTHIATSVSHAEYVEAFYTTGAFKLERLILKWLVAKPSSDSEARALAQAEVDTFAAWSVEGRAPDQLLVCDYLNRTRSWLMNTPAEGGSTGTRLYFGTAVVPARLSSGVGRLFPFEALLGFHKLYSRILLGAARSRLARRFAGP